MSQIKRQSGGHRSKQEGDPKTQTLELVLPVRLDHDSTASLWVPWVTKTRQSDIHHVVIRAEELKQCDGSGFGLLSYLHKTAVQQGKTFELKGLTSSFNDLLLRHSPPLDQSKAPHRVHANLLSFLGKKTCYLISDLHEQINFLGHLTLAAIVTLVKPTRFRWREFIRVTELAGANALGIMTLLGFLFGLIMSFSSAMPMAQFGVEIYVVDLVAFAMTRVLGPFVAAILLAGRTGSAFAAELGTMKINNELDALEVMNLKPMNFLVLPRVAATITMAPMLTIVTVLVSLMGCAMVILSMGYPMTAFNKHVQDILTSMDIWIGLFKAVVFGGIVGAVGCLRGLQTGTGAGAVGASTTRAVVTSIVLLVMTEGVFSVLLYVLEL